MVWVLWPPIGTMKTGMRWIKTELEKEKLLFSKVQITGVPMGRVRKQVKDAAGRVIRLETVAEETTRDYDMVYRDPFDVISAMYADPTTHQYTSRQPRARRDGLIVDTLSADRAVALADALPDGCAIFLVDWAYDVTHMGEVGRQKYWRACKGV